MHDIQEFLTGQELFFNIFGRRIMRSKCSTREDIYGKATEARRSRKEHMS